MEWIKIEDEKPPKYITIFICGVDTLSQDKNFYYAEATYNGNDFDYPYYGQTITGSFKKPTHWIKPEAPKA
jgi:hypothetical protein